MKVYGEVEVQFQNPLISTQDGGELSVLRPDRFIPVEQTPVSIG
jgi:hypothetical protein